MKDQTSAFWRVDFIHKAIGSCISEQVEATSRAEAVQIARERLGERWEPFEVHRVEVDENGNHWIVQSWRFSRSQIEPAEGRPTIEGAA